MTETLPAVSERTHFRVNGRPVEAGGPGGRRLLDVLRLELGLAGTKEGCGEGECGACSVLVDGVVVNSCLVPLGQVDGREILTVEGLADDGRLGPLQQSFLEAGGAQCGFCTPGMLMTAQALLATGRSVTEPVVREAIAGNLCRCTGYTKVIEAIELAADEAAGRAAAPDETPTPGGGTAATILRAAGSTGPRLVRPSSLSDALARLAADPELRPIAGGTDVMVELAAGSASPRRPLLDLADIDELHGIEVLRDELVLGSMTTFAELRASSMVRHAMPVLEEAATSIGAAQIQHRGTVGGNCVTASPAGDLLPVLLAADAQLEVAGPNGTRMIPADAFWTDYRRTAMAAGELLVAIRIPLEPGRVVRYRKVGTRRAQAIAKVVIAVAWRTGEVANSHGVPWRDVRVALGSVAPTPIRANRTEAALEGSIPSPEGADRAAAIVRDEISPIDDIRSTAAYRRAVTGRILRRIVLDAAG